MPRRTTGWVPKLQRVVGRGVGRVRFPGERDCYFGKTGDWAEGKDPPRAILQAYQRACADWLRRQAAAEPVPPQDGRTVAELVAQYLMQARGRPTEDGRPTGRFLVLRTSLIRLVRVCGGRTIDRVTVADYVRLRDEVVRAGLADSTAREYCKLVRRFLRWARAPRSMRDEIEDLPPPPGGYGRRSVPVQPVPDADIDAVLPHCTPKVRAMLELQRLTGMRQGEVSRLRAGEVDREADPTRGRSRCWLYVPLWHKKRHLAKERRVWIGPKAREVLAPWLIGLGPDDVVFPSRTGGGKYGPAGYRTALTTACRRAGVPAFRPNQIRHAAATRLEAADPRGVTAAQAVLGHESPAMTRRYSTALDEIAREVMRRHG